MKLILSILLLLSTSNIFAQNKHSELYNQIETIIRTVLKSEIDSFNFEKYRAKSKIILSCQPSFNLDTLPPVLFIDDIVIKNYNKLDSILSDSISSIEIFQGNSSYAIAMFGARGKKGVIVLKTMDYYNNHYKKKKRK
jgi:hypothetical protein